MKTIKGVELLKDQEISQVNGGSQENYNSGKALGASVRRAIGDACDAVGGFISGLFGN